MGGVRQSLTYVSRLGPGLRKTATPATRRIIRAVLSQLAEHRWGESGRA